jgi:hypothetical protein
VSYNSVYFCTLSSTKFLYLPFINKTGIDRFQDCGKTWSFLIFFSGPMGSIFFNNELDTDNEPDTEKINLI